MQLSISKYCCLKNGVLNVDGIIISDNTITNSDIEFLTIIYREHKVNYPKFFKMDSLSKTGFIAAEMLLRNTNMYSDETKLDTGLVFSNRTSSLDTDKDYQQTIGEEYFPSPSLFVYTLPNIVMGEIAIKHKIFGENTFFVSEKFDIKNICNYVCQIFKEKKVNQVIIGWVDFYNKKAEAFLLLVENKKCESEFNSTELKKLFKKNNIDYLK